MKSKISCSLTVSKRYFLALSMLVDGLYFTALCLHMSSNMSVMFPFSPLASAMACLAIAWKTRSIDICEGFVLFASCILPASTLAARLVCNLEGTPRFTLKGLIGKVRFCAVGK